MIERRRFNRVHCNAIFSLAICDSYKIKNRNNGSVTGEMIDFSLRGACILSDKIQYGWQHIFNSTQHHNDEIIRLEYLSDNNNDPLVIYGKSAWYNQSFFNKTDKMRFKLGIEFLKDQSQDILQDFYTTMVRCQKAQKILQ